MPLTSRSSVILFRVTQQERDMIASQATRDGLKLSEWVRSILMEYCRARAREKS